MSQAADYSCSDLFTPIMYANAPLSCLSLLSHAFSLETSAGRIIVEAIRNHDHVRQASCLPEPCCSQIHCTVSFEGLHFVYELMKVVLAGKLKPGKGNHGQFPAELCQLIWLLSRVWQFSGRLHPQCAKSDGRPGEIAECTEQ